MTYKIVYQGGNNYAYSRLDLIKWLEILKDEAISDIRKIYRSGDSVSVIDRYCKYVRKNAPAVMAHQPEQ